MSRSLPIAGDDGMPVPVYDCHVIFARDADGTLHARVTTLPGIATSGRSERDILQRIVRDFKSALVRYRSSGEPVPWITTPPAPGPDEFQRWIPVHL